MSVKDRIAMWNNMSTSSNATTTNNAPKVTTSTFVPKPAQQQQEHMRTSENLAQKHHQVEAVTIVKPSDLKKKAQMEQNSPNKQPEYVTKPSQPSYKAPETAKNTNSNTSNQHSIQSPTIPKPSDIKKQFQQQISGNSFHFIAPVPIKKVDSVTVEPKQETGSRAEYEIERDVPTVSVKQSAQKLGQFYQKKNEQQSKPKEVEPVPEVHEQKHHQQQAPLTTQHHQPIHQLHKQAPPSENNFILPPQNKEVPAPQAVEVKEQQKSQEMDLALRLKQRNKKRRVNFDSDED